MALVIDTRPAAPMPEWPLPGLPPFIGSANLGLLSTELDRYLSGEVPGRSFLIAGHRGSGKTSLVRRAIEDCRGRVLREIIDAPRISTGQRRLLRRPLLVPLHGPTLLAAPAATGRQRETSADLAGRALQHVALALWRALSEEAVTAFRTHALLLSGRTRGPQTDEWIELSAQLALELDRAPDPGLLRAFWYRMHRLEEGLFWPLEAGRWDTGPSTRGADEILALAAAGQAFRVCAGQEEAKDTLTDGASLERAGQSGAALAWNGAVNRLASVAAGGVTLASLLAAKAVDPALAVGAGLAVGAVAGFGFEASTKWSAARRMERTYSFVLDRTPRSLERDLPGVLRRLQGAGLYPVFVIDELDKLDAPSDPRRDPILDSLSYLKPLTTDFGFFCFLTDRSYYDELRRRSRFSEYDKAHSYFSHRIFVSYGPKDLKDYLAAILTSDLDPDAAGAADEAFALQMLQLHLLHEARLGTLDLVRGLAGLGAGERSDGPTPLRRDAQSIIRDRRIELSAVVQLAVELLLRDPPLAARIEAEPLMGQLATDALYFFSRRWAEGADGSHILILGRGPLLCYLAQRITGRACAGDAEGLAEAERVLGERLGEGDRELLVRQADRLLNDLVSFSRLRAALEASPPPEDEAIIQLLDNRPGVLADVPPSPDDPPGQRRVRLLFDAYGQELHTSDPAAERRHADWDEARDGEDNVIPFRPDEAPLVARAGRRAPPRGVDFLIRPPVAADPGIPVSTDGHSGPVVGALTLPDDRILSWSEDGTLRLWSVDGAPGAVLEGHGDKVRGALVLRDGRLLSWSDDGTLRLWAADGDALAVFRGHTDATTGAIQLPDGRILSWSDDTTLRFWTNDGMPLSVLDGHSDWVRGALLLPEGRLLSWSDDGTLRIWSANGELLSVRTGHKHWVTGALVLSDGRLLSWSEDATLRLWTDDGSPLAELPGHAYDVAGALEMPGGRLLSWSMDETLRIWAPDGSVLHVLSGHRDSVIGALLLPDDRILSWSADHTLRLWTFDGVPGAVLKGHEAPVSGACLLDDRRLLSWSEDASLRLWSDEGSRIVILPGHTGEIFGAREVPEQQRLLSWSADGTLRLWSRERAVAQLGPGGLRVRIARLLARTDALERLFRAAGSTAQTIVAHGLMPRTFDWPEVGRRRALLSVSAVQRDLERAASQLKEYLSPLDGEEGADRVIHIAETLMLARHMAETNGAIDRPERIGAALDALDTYVGLRFRPERPPMRAMFTPPEGPAMPQLPFPPTLDALADWLQGERPQQPVTPLEQRVARSWERWRGHVFEFLSTGVAPPWPYAYDDVLLATGRTAPGWLFGPDLSRMTARGWSELALHVLNAPDAGPPWALAAALQCLGFDVGALAGRLREKDSRWADVILEDLPRTGPFVAPTRPDIAAPLIIAPGSSRLGRQPPVPGRAPNIVVSPTVARLYPAALEQLFDLGVVESVGYER